MLASSFFYKLYDCWIIRDLKLDGENTWEQGSCTVNAKLRGAPAGVLGHLLASFQAYFMKNCLILFVLVMQKGSAPNLWLTTFVCSVDYWPNVIIGYKVQHGLKEKIQLENARAPVAIVKRMWPEFRFKSWLDPNVFSAMALSLFKCQEEQLVFHSNYGVNEVHQQLLN